MPEHPRLGSRSLLFRSLTPAKKSRRVRMYQFLWRQCIESQHVSSTARARDVPVRLSSSCLVLTIRDFVTLGTFHILIFWLYSSISMIHGCFSTSRASLPSPPRLPHLLDFFGSFRSTSLIRRQTGPFHGTYRTPNFGIDCGSSAPGARRS